MRNFLTAALLAGTALSLAPVAQAEITAMFGPIAPVSMAMWPEAASGRMFARKNGLIRRTARSLVSVEA